MFVNHMSCVTCLMKPIISPMSTSPTATDTHPPSANSPTLHRRLGHQDRTKTPKIILK